MTEREQIERLRADNAELIFALGFAANQLEFEWRCSDRSPQHRICCALTHARETLGRVRAHLLATRPEEPQS